MKNTSTAPLDRRWHLARDASEINVAELEFALMRVTAAFERWQQDCVACCSSDNLGASDNAVLHVIRMHDRAKGLSEIARLLNRDDTSNLQYNLRKLSKAGLIENAGEPGSKRGAAYRASPKGIKLTDSFSEFRKELLISLIQGITNVDQQLEDTVRLLNLLAGIYGQAACVAATHRLSPDEG